MNNPFEIPVPPEDFGPSFATWDVCTKNQFLEKRLLQLKRQLCRQEHLADNQRNLYKTIHEDYEKALAQLSEKNDELRRISQELLRVKTELEREVSKRTRALERKNANLEEYLRQLEQSNIALDVLLGKHVRDRETLKKEMSAMRSLILADLEELLRMSSETGQQTIIKRILAKIQTTNAQQHGPGLPHMQSRLSERESTVAHLISEGHDARTVAKILHISVRCVHSHCYNIRKKLNLSRKTRLKNYLKQAYEQ